MASIRGIRAHCKTLVVSSLALVAACAVLSAVLVGCSSPSPKASTTSDAELAQVQVGDVINFGETSFAPYFGGSYSDDLPWLVLSVEGDKALIISEDIIELRPFWEGYSQFREEWEAEDAAIADSIDSEEEWDAYIASRQSGGGWFEPIAATWENSTIRQWLNGEFYNSLPSSLKEKTVLASLSNEDNPVYSDANSLGGADTEDKVFLLSIEEAFSLFETDAARVAKTNLDPSTTKATSAIASQTPDTWILRTPGFWFNQVAFVSGTGDIGYEGESVPTKTGGNLGPAENPAGGLFVEDEVDEVALGSGIRPAMWISIPSKREKTKEIRPLASDGAETAATPDASNSVSESDAEFPEGAIKWTEAQLHVGETVTIYGPVMGATYASTSKGSPTFVDIGAAYPDKSRVTMTIWGEDRGAFLPSPEAMFQGKTVCVSGKIYLYNGVCNIEVVSPGQVEVIK